jgi:hypothetical protein
MCGQAFEAEPNAMVTIGLSDYLVYEDDMELLGNDLLRWEGNHVLSGKPVANKIQEDNLVVVAIRTPAELGNNAVCACSACRAKLPKLE